MQKSGTIRHNLVRESNRNMVINMIREREPISQVEIASVTTLSKTTVTHIIRELSNLNLIKEVGVGKSRGGRKPTLLRFNPEAQYVIGAEFYADEMNVAVLNLAASIKKRINIPTEPEKGQEAVFKKFAQVTKGLLEELRVKKNDVLGVGVSFEGIVDHDKGELVYNARFGWRNVPIKESIEKELGFRTFVENNVRTMVLGEHWHGVGKGVGDIVGIDIDAGIGANVISDGRIYRGTHSMAGEIGHTVAVPEGPECMCGNKGCLEMVASGSAILNKVRQGLQNGRKSSISDMVNSSSTLMAIRAVFDAARQGDKFALEVINEAVHYLGMAIAAVINFADPDLVVLTGCVTYESKGMLLKIIKEIVQEHVVDSSSRTIRIEEGVLGENVALIGAATLVYREVFKLPIVHS